MQNFISSFVNFYAFGRFSIAINGPILKIIQPSDHTAHLIAFAQQLPIVIFDGNICVRTTKWTPIDDSFQMGLSLSFVSLSLTLSLSFFLSLSLSFSLFLSFFLSLFLSFSLSHSLSLERSVGNLFEGRNLEFIIISN